jgi:transcriptional regulator with XRE-family HTH domain
MGRRRSDQTTPLSEWLDRHKEAISRDAFATKLGMARQNVDRLARGGFGRRPGIDLAFDLEDVTAEVTKGKDILDARTWWLPPDQRPRRPQEPPKKSRKAR